MTPTFSASGVTLGNKHFTLSQITERVLRCRIESDGLALLRIEWAVDDIGYIQIIAAPLFVLVLLRNALIGVRFAFERISDEMRELDMRIIEEEASVLHFLIKRPSGFSGNCSFTEVCEARLEEPGLPAEERKKLAEVSALVSEIKAYHAL